MFGWGKKRATASARHILVETETLAETLKAEIEAGAEFADLAKEHSTCPSAQNGGTLGHFRSGAMVKPFNDVVFSAELHQVHGPVKTKFGYHLIEITERNKPK
ncbi:MAG: peptidylprolyl isomerase [Ghiorsea sp.]